MTAAVLGGVAIAAWLIVMAAVETVATWYWGGRHFWKRPRKAGPVETAKPLEGDTYRTLPRP